MQRHASLKRKKMAEIFSRPSFRNGCRSLTRTVTCSAINGIAFFWRPFLCRKHPNSTSGASIRVVKRFTIHFER
ncbi:uncharacterized protein H6S33_003997 [Morchella sextelata]|uniref:uncharacterized protein n=1 Tax=Morchella sextelata TaxID=1174677 RepID=UPI001D03B91F|nr:uncharacterized protein H6S33_003997 [Morchella sextelata]KAH0606336.1 hypothetical protein H6S33_003997 [Morchella sextelata]